MKNNGCNFGISPIILYGFIPPDLKVESLLCKERESEINSCLNEGLKKQKYCVWKLLEVAVQKYTGKSISDFKFRKLENGKWFCEDFYFSLTHSENLVAVAIDSKPVGIDGQIKRKISQNLAKRALCEQEFERYSALSEEEKQEFLLTAWIKKESAFKKSNDKIFTPANYNSLSLTAPVYELENNGEKYALTTVFSCFKKVEIELIKL